MSLELWVELGVWFLLIKNNRFNKNNLFNKLLNKNKFFSTIKIYNNESEYKFLF